MTYLFRRRRINWLPVIGIILICLAWGVYAQSFYAGVGAAIGAAFFVEMLGWLFVSRILDEKNEENPESPKKESAAKGNNSSTLPPGDRDSQN